MATDDREVMEVQGAGESCPTFPKMAPDDPMSEGKLRAALEAEAPKPDSSYDYLEELETYENRDDPGPPKSLSPKAGPTTKGQAGDGPELTKLPWALGTSGTKCNVEMELERVRMEFELTRLRYLHEENERQRQHEEVMEQLQQQATPHLFSGGLQDLLLPQNQFAMFLYCFIFIHIIYVTKEIIFFLFSKHYLFCIAGILLCLIKTLCTLCSYIITMLPRSDPEGSHSLSEEMSPRHMENVKTSMVKESEEREVPGAQGERKSSQKSSPQEQMTDYQQVP
ncbi:transmembrane protein 247 [Pteropus alecto]|uniref:transmembrane protein 247 n=1 Tax=Pteropus alecto TaxID=9402 RepID=UPI00076878A7|nr:transmembrane protein 247 [Pteropus alecto]